MVQFWGTTTESCAAIIAVLHIRQKRSTPVVGDTENTYPLTIQLLK